MHTVKVGGVELPLVTSSILADKLKCRSHLALFVEKKKLALHCKLYRAMRFAEREPKIDGKCRLLINYFIVTLLYVFVMRVGGEFLPGLLVTMFKPLKLTLTETEQRERHFHPALSYLSSQSTLHLQ